MSKPLRTAAEVAKACSYAWQTDFINAASLEAHLAKAIEVDRAEVRAAVLEEARLIACEFRNRCDGETEETDRRDGWCSYCKAFRAAIAKATGTTPEGGNE